MVGYSDRDIRRRAKVVNEYKKFQAKCCFVVLSGVVSFFLVPLFIDYIDWDIKMNVGSQIVELDGFILYVLLLMLFYIMFRVAYYWKIRRIQKGKYRSGVKAEPRTRR